MNASSLMRVQFRDNRQAFREVLGVIDQDRLDNQADTPRLYFLYLIPTPVTENIIGRVREALQLLDTSVLEGDVFDAAVSERAFRVSMNDVSESLLLPELMDELGRHAPHMSVESYFTPRRDLPFALSSGQLELAIDIVGAGNTQLCHAPLFRERYVCAVRNNHPDIGDTLSLEQYLSLGHIHVSSRRQGQGLVDLESQLLWHKSADGDQANRWLRDRVIALCER
jgi:DNA-binding transcriptional LysR family regulator